MPAAVLDNQRSLLAQLDTQPRVRDFLARAVEAGRMAYEAGLGAVAENFEADASSPLTAFLDEE